MSLLSTIDISNLYKVKPQPQHHLEQIILRFSINAWNKISSSRAFDNKELTMVILNWGIRRPRPFLAFLSSPRLSIYTFRFRTTPPPASLPSNPPPLSFILSTFLRRRDAARYGPRPSYSARRSTREVHPEDLIGRKREREKEKGKGSVPRWCAGSRDETLSESEQPVLFHTGGHPRATHRRTTPTRAPIRTPRLWKKKLGYP